MRRTTMVVVPLLIAGGLALAGCDTTVTSEPDSEPDPAVAEDGAAPDSSGSGKESAAVGDSITLDGFDTTVQATVLEVQNPVPSTNQFIEPDAGNQFAAVRMRIRNTGDAPFDDSISNGAAVVDARDVEWDATIFEVKEPALGSLTIAPGDSRQGWVSFEVSTAPLRTFQWSTESGFGDTGQWSL